MNRLILVFFFAQIFVINIQSQEITVNVEIEKSQKEQVSSEGKLYLFVVQSDRGEPRFNTWPSGSNQIFVASVADWDISKKISLAGKKPWKGVGGTSFSDLGDGPYYAQIVYYHKQNESRINTPGNLYSQKLKIDRFSGDFDFILSDRIPDHSLNDHPLLKEVKIKSEVLSTFWGKDIYVRAAVILPATFEEEQNRKYPLRVNIAGYGGRYTRANGLMRKNGRFEKFWTGDDCPQMISLILDGEGPFGDCYQLDSDNSGPYGEMLTTELIPYVENTYRGLGTADSRFVDGCSTGGWVSLALQLYYPDFFNGCFSYSPDAVDFSRFQLINVYKDKNAFENEYGLERPVARTTNGEPTLSMKRFIDFENIQGKNGTYVTSGGQFSAFTALYGPRGADGLPIPLFDPESGDMNSEVAEHWKKYDLTLHTKNNWATLGPKIQGKIWIWMGDMDNFYLNMATRSFDEMLKEQKNPISDASINFTEMQGHCWQYSHEEVVRQIGRRIESLN